MYGNAENSLEMDCVFKVFCGSCPDQACSAFIYFDTAEKSITCDSCFQTHNITDLLNRHEVDKDFGFRKLWKKFIPAPKVGTDFVKVNGLSNFRCKLLSPFLTTYGMDKVGNAKLLKELGHSDTIDCGKVLGNRSFMILPEHLNIKGYGKDQSGSLDYLHEFLNVLKEYHNNEERLIPIHVDGDGHCLVHALSRGLIGRELFWHSLRKNLMNHLQQRISDYMEFFKDFHDKDEWKGIIEEADPNCTFGAGLGNIHIFALSNILKRPIMLIDLPQKMNNAGDYAGLFVPALVEPHLCNNKSPLCIAWSGRAHNHFVPLVAVHGRPLPTIPNHFIPDPWAVSPYIANQYLLYNEDGSLTVGDGKPLNNNYIQKLVSAMEGIFLQHNAVAPLLVEDLCRCSYQLAEIPGLRPEDITHATKTAAIEKRLFRCLICKALQEVFISEKYLEPGGKLYEMVVECHKVPKPDKLYTFSDHNLQCSYNSDADRLEIFTTTCHYCRKKETRLVTCYGDILYSDGDVTETRSTVSTKYNCGLKYFWNGKKYDNFPKKLTITQKWSGEEIEAEIIWFYGDSNPELNSSAEEEAKKIAQVYFPNDCNNNKLLEELAQNIHEKCAKLKVQDKLPIEQDAATTSFSSISCSAETNLKQEFGHERDQTDQTKPSDVDTSSSVLESSTVLSSAYKRKSNGEPTASVSYPTQSNQQPPKSDSGVLIKIRMDAGETKTLRVHQETTMQTLQEKICSMFMVEPDRQILKHGYPPKLLVSPTDGGSLGLKSGDMIKLNVIALKHEGNREMNSSGILNEINKMREKLELSSHDQSSPLSTQRTKQIMARNNLLASKKNSNCKTMWEFVINKPELFHPEGYFYEQFRLDIGLIPGKHCSLPLIPEHIFYYNERNDRLDLCLEPRDGHYPVDDDIKSVLKRYRQLTKNESTQDISDNNQCNPQIHNELPSHLKTESTSDLHLKDVPSKPVSLAPGYHTIGDVPTNISSEEKLSQRQGLEKLVGEIKARHTSS